MTTKWNFPDTKIDYEEFENRISQKFLDLTKDFNIISKIKASAFLRKFWESIDQSSLRYEELEAAEQKLKFMEYGVDLNISWPLQKRFVDKTEAFHQQVYSTLSILVGLLNHVAPKDFKNRIDFKKCIRSIEYFLNKLDDLVNKNKLLYLKRSQEFRSKFIDHPQQHKLYDFMTLCTEKNQCHVIFYVNENDKEARRFDLSEISSAMMISPIAATNHFIPPYYKDVAQSMADIPLEVFEALNP